MDLRLNITFRTQYTGIGEECIDYENTNEHSLVPD